MAAIIGSLRDLSYVPPVPAYATTKLRYLLCSCQVAPGQSQAAADFVSTNTQTYPKAGIKSEWNIPY